MIVEMTKSDFDRLANRKPSLCTGCGTDAVDYRSAKDDSVYCDECLYWGKAGQGLEPWEIIPLKPVVETPREFTMISSVTGW